MSTERIATNAIDQNKIVSCAARSFAIRFRFLYSSPHCVSCVRYLGSTTNRHESQQRMQQVIVAKGTMSVSGEDWARYMKMTVADYLDRNAELLGKNVAEKVLNHIKIKKIEK